MPMSYSWPSHGKVDCRKCFSGSETTAKQGDWLIRNDPGAWGSSNPEVLVLGFSKGATQANIYESGKFDDIAFGGKQTRSNLTQILRRVGLLDDQETIDEKISAEEETFAFGSLVRCSLSRLDQKTGSYKTSGPLINKSFREIPHIVNNCSQRFLKNLPQSLRLVVFLGTSDSYIKHCRETVKCLHPNDFGIVNDVAYASGQLLWLHVTHPSKGNGSIKAWLEGDEANKAGLKNALAIRAISRCASSLSPHYASSRNQNWRSMT